jgi:hypothetical protein
MGGFAFSRAGFSTNFWISFLTVTFFLPFHLWGLDLYPITFAIMTKIWKLFIYYLDIEGMTLPHQWIRAFPQH